MGEASSIAEVRRTRADEMSSLSSRREGLGMTTVAGGKLPEKICL